MANEKYSKNIPKNFECKKCNYICSKQSILNKHFLTRKHQMLTEEHKMLTDANNVLTNNNFTCNCGKIFKHKSSMSRHKKNCNYEVCEEIKEETNIEKQMKNLNTTDYKSMLMLMIKENNDMRKQICELIPKVNNTTNNNTTNNNTHNNTLNQKFNINVFLNEQCKDALNMNDFIKSIEISLEQLDFTKKNGLVDGLSNAIVENMNKLSLFERPMHCTDTKRETLYIKEEDKWTKDDNKEKIKDAIKKASSKNYNALHEWKIKNPDFTEDDLKQEYFSNIISTIGKTGEQIDDKIIKNLCKETYIKK